MKKLLYFLIIAIIVVVMPISADATTYYMRGDGTATEKGDAIGGCASAATAMNCTVHNGETFSSGDIIKLCDDGEADFLCKLQTRTAGVTYQAETGDTPIVDARDVDQYALEVLHNNITVTGITFYGGYTALVSCGNTDNFTFTYNTLVQDNLAQGIQGGGTTGSNNHVIAYNIITYDQSNCGTCSKDGIRYTRTSLNLSIHDNVISNWPHCGILVGQDSLAYRVEDVYIYRNKVTANGTTVRGYGRAFAIEGKETFESGLNGVGKVYIYQNYFKNLRARDQITAQYVYVYANIFHDYRNPCIGTGSGYESCPENINGGCGTCGDWSDAQGKGQAMKVSDYGGSTPNNVYIWNNTFSQCSETAILVDPSGVINPLYITNNIFDNNARWANHTVDEPTGTVSTTIWTDYSLVAAESTTAHTIYAYNNAFTSERLEGNPDIYWDGTPDAAITVTTLNGKATADGNVEDDTSCLTDPANGDFTIGATSMCRNAALSVYTSPYNAAPYYDNVIAPNSDLTANPMIIYVMTSSDIGAVGFVDSGVERYNVVGGANTLTIGGGNVIVIGGE